MFRWISCCFLVLGMTALAREQSGPGPVADPDSTVEDQTFGLQVKVGLDGSVRPDRPPKRKDGKVTQVNYADEQPEIPSLDAGHSNLVDWQNETEQFVEVESHDSRSDYEWQVLPVGLMYKAYLAGEKESRMQSVWMSSRGRDGILWECTLGGHVGLLRYGTTDSVNPNGWQLDLEGAALPRVDMGHNDDLEAVDFRAGFLSTWRYDANAYKIGYYHLSSHTGDEFLIRNPGYNRLNYVRDSFIAGYTRNITRDLQGYGEIGYAFNHEDGAEPLELQYGLQYTPMVFGLRGAPFAAINGHTRQDFGYATSVNINAGWQWRGATNHIWRFGVQYYKGPALQYSFAGQKETLFGAGMWMDY